jgi:hypothetical protein
MLCGPTNLPKTDRRFSWHFTNMDYDHHILGSSPRIDQNSPCGDRPRHGGAFGLGATGVRYLLVLSNGGNMISMLQFDQSTLAKLPPERDNPAIRKYIADEISSAALKEHTSPWRFDGRRSQGSFFLQAALG